MKYKVDLHTHTNVSDGASTYKELVETAVKENIKDIALTNHDNIGDLEEASIFAEQNNIDFLTGIEISSLYKEKRIIHILGLGIDLSNKEFLDAIMLIKKSGGLSFLAHYNKFIGFSGLNNEDIEKEIKYLISVGLDGVERYYPSFKEKDYEFLDYLINKYDLMISGGTDYHGLNRPEIKLGIGKNNNLFIQYSVYEKIASLTDRKK